MPSTSFALLFAAFIETMDAVGDTQVIIVQHNRKALSTLRHE